MELAVVHFEVDHDAMLANLPIQGVLGCLECVEERYFAFQLGNLFQRQRFKSAVTESTMQLIAKLNSYLYRAYFFKLSRVIGIKQPMQPRRSRLFLWTFFNVTKMPLQSILTKISLLFLRYIKFRRC